MDERLQESVLSVDEVVEECARHNRLDLRALAALAPTAADGHAAHLVLYSAEHADRWRTGASTPPSFVTRTKTGCHWAEASRQAASPQARYRLARRSRAGAIATGHLVTLAEPMIRRVVRDVWPCCGSTAVVGIEDMLNVARAAVTQGIWAYDPASLSGPGYLRAWIEEHIKREVSALACPVTLPARAHRRFQRITAIRCALFEQLGRVPTDQEILAHGGVSQPDLDDERATRQARARLSQLEDAEATVVDESAHRTFAAVESPSDAAHAGWRIALDTLRLDDRQLDIIARHAGLPPHECLDPADRSERSIASTLDIPRSAVRRVLTAMRAAVTATNGPFHRMLDQLSPDDREGLGLQRFAQLLASLPA